MPGDVDVFLLDLLRNDARLYKRFTAKGSHGNYHIEIKGLGGVYFFWAPEFGETGYFLSIDDASDAILHGWADTLSSVMGRNFRKPFNNDLIQRDLSRAKSEHALEKARNLLQSVSEDQRQLLWIQVLGGAILTDTEVCAKILALWNLQTSLDKWPVAKFNLVARITLVNGGDVIRYLRDTGQVHIIEEIQMTARKDVMEAEQNLQSSSGLARIGAAQAIDAARHAETTIQKAILDADNSIERV